MINIYEAVIKYTGAFIAVLVYQLLAHNINIELALMAAFVMCVFMELAEGIE